MDPVGDILKDLLSSTGISYTKIVRYEIAGQTIFSIETETDARTFIGAHGDTIYALDLLVKKIVEQKIPIKEGEDGPMFLVDVNDYRAKQIKDLQTKAIMMAERAR